MANVKMEGQCEGRNGDEIVGEMSPSVFDREVSSSTLTLDDAYRRDLLAVFRELRSFALSNIEYYRDAGSASSANDSDSARQRMYSAFSRLHEHIDRGIQPGIEYLLSIAHMYDCDQTVRANGYRSFVMVVERCCQRLLALSRYIACHRDSLLFRLDHNSRELDAFVTTLGQLRACMYYLHKLVAYCNAGKAATTGNLFPDDQDEMSADDQRVAEQLMAEVEMLCQESFYGRCLGFQFSDSMIRPLTAINLVLASFSQGYQHDSALLQLASSVLNSGKYVMDPDRRGRQVVEATRNGDVSFCKAFWSLNENPIMHKMPSLVCPSIRVNHVFNIEPTAFELSCADGASTVTITPPCAHTGPGPVSVRLMCRDLRQGQELLTKTATSSLNNIRPRSTGLIIHCHGGGFVAQSSASHGVYLRHWAHDCDVPILCVDYSLAPELAYPRQLEEVFFAYCWAIKNCHMLGSTGERVCLVGDSAGGTLAVATAIRARSYGIRSPDAVLSVYGCLLVKYAPSPSRLLAVMDPLLPLGVLPKCLAAYTGISSEVNSNEPQPTFQFPVITTPEVDLISNRFATGTGIVTANASAAKTHNDDMPNGKTDSSFGQFRDDNDSGYTDNEAVATSGNGTGCELTTGGTSTASRQSLKLDLPSSSEDGRNFSSATSVCSVGRTVSTPAFSTPVESVSHIDVTNVDDGISSPSSPKHWWSTAGAFSTPTYAKMRHFAQSPVQPFARAAVAVSRNPFMSPLLASDELLKELCPIYMVTCHLDPMLDDSIMFAKRLRQVGHTVHCDVLDGLPHGFLNFVLMSPDAKAGSDLCIRRLREILQVPPEDTKKLD